MKARDLFEIHGAPAPTVEPAPPKPKPTYPPPTPAPAPPHPKPKFPNPFKPTEPGIETTPKACSRGMGESRAAKVVNELLEAKLYAQPTPPYAYQKTCPRCGKAMASSHGPCQYRQRRQQPQFQPAARSVNTPAPVAPGQLTA